MAAANEAIEIMDRMLSLDPTARIARDPNASTAARLEAMDQLQQQRCAGGRPQQLLQQGVVRGQQPAQGARGGGSSGRNPFDARNRNGNSNVGNGYGNNNGGRAKLSLGGGVLYVGSVGGVGPSGGKPHGVGELLLKDGSVHAGHFEGAPRRTHASIPRRAVGCCCSLLPPPTPLLLLSLVLLVPPLPLYLLVYCCCCPWHAPTRSPDRDTWLLLRRRRRARRRCVLRSQRLCA